MKNCFACAAIIVLLGGPHAFAASPPIKLSISPQAASVVAGQNMRINLTITNTSGSPVAVTQTNAPGHAEFNYAINIARRDGGAVTKTAYGRALGGQGGGPLIVESSHQVKLSPAKSIKTYFLVNQVYDVSRPGVYVVKVLKIGAPGTQIQSNSIQITVH